MGSEVALVRSLTVGLVKTLTLGTMVALSFDISLKREPRAVWGSYFSTAVCFVASGCVVRITGVPTGVFVASAFFVARGIGAAGLFMGAEATLSLGLLNFLISQSDKLLI